MVIDVVRAKFVFYLRLRVCDRSTRTDGCDGYNSLKYVNDQQITCCQKLKKTFQFKDSPTCESDVVNNVLKSVNIARLPVKIRRLAAERLQTVWEA